MASGETYTKQERAWGVLYDRIQKVMRPLGKESGIGEGDYWLVDDNWGATQHKLGVNNLKLLDPKIVKQLQNCLRGYPDWEIVVAVDVLGPGESWPEMGLCIRLHEIVDELQRQYLPPEFQQLKYEGSRKGPAWPSSE
jgi:hypothetical protein